LIGTTIDGKYRVVRLIGKGAMGSVYEAERAGAEGRVAIKLLHGEVVRHEGRLRRFHREARAAAAVSAEHIVQVLDQGTDAATGAPYIVHELLEGRDLQQLLDRCRVLQPDTTLRIVAQACAGLTKAHEARVLHRDVKPANLFLARQPGGAVVVKIVDFGVAKIKRDPGSGTASTELTRAGGILGSPFYMSPEQARGLKSTDFRTDLWSLGVVLYRALSGTTPHASFENLAELVLALCTEPPLPLQEIAPWVPPEVAAIAGKALQINPGARFPTAGAMLAAIDALLPSGHALREEMLVPR
jgi:eukaryotic-like serine/threonine-protein kinase